MYRWQNLSDEELLKLRFCDLRIDWQKTPLKRFTEKLLAELEAKSLRLKPSFWLSREFFVADGSTGIALPFYLAHPRLKALEMAQMGEVEGGSDREMMKLLRHELGHVIDNAYRLRRRKPRQQIFGFSTQKYQGYYEPRAYSRNYVRHIEAGYAQSHPDEDFAETFAVWLTPRSGWKKKYADWPALRKLEYIEELMTDLKGKRPLIVDHEKIEPLSELTQTLGQHYRKKKAYKRIDKSPFDSQLCEIFSESSGPSLASSYLRSLRKEVLVKVAAETGIYQYRVKQVVDKMIDRCQQLNLKLPSTSSDLDQKVLGLFVKQSQKFIEDGWHKEAR